MASGGPLSNPIIMSNLSSKELPPKLPPKISSSQYLVELSLLSSISTASSDNLKVLLTFIPLLYYKCITLYIHCLTFLANMYCFCLTLSCLACIKPLLVLLLCSWCSYLIYLYIVRGDLPPTPVPSCPLLPLFYLCYSLSFFSFFLLYKGMMLCKCEVVMLVV